MSASMQPMYGGTAPAGFGARRYNLVSDLAGSPAFGNPGYGNAITQGAAFDARAAFIAGLSSYATESFESQLNGGGEAGAGAMTNYDKNSPLSIFSGAGSLKQFDHDFVQQPYGRIMRRSLPTDLSASSGRWNTTASGKQFWETPRWFWMEFSANHQAFGFYTTDLLDFLAGYVQILVYNGTKLVDVIDVAGRYAAGATPTPASVGLTWVDFAYSDISFNKLVVVYTQTGNNWDYGGFDDMIVGTPTPAYVASAVPLEYVMPPLYGYDQFPPVYEDFDTYYWEHPPTIPDRLENDAYAKRLIWNANTTNQATLTFEPQAVGAVPATITFPAPRASLVATITASGATIVSEDAQAPNFTTGGTKTLKSTGDVEFQLSAPVDSVCFYFTRKTTGSYSVGNPTRYKVILYMVTGPNVEIEIPVLTGALVDPNSYATTTYTEIGHYATSEFWGLVGDRPFNGFKLERTTFVNACVLGLDDVSVGTYVP